MSAVARPYIGMLFRCCHIYLRIYLNRDGTAYAGSCPRCGVQVQIQTGEGGSRSRFWAAG